MKKKEKTTDPVLFVFILIALISGALLVYYLLGYKKSNDFYNKANEGIKILQVTKEENEDFSFDKNENFIVEEDSIDLDINFSEYPKSVIGWIYIPDEEKDISFPIVQGKDNEFYLNHDYLDKYNKSGSIFLHSGNSPFLTDYHSVIYGHNMKFDGMFSRIKKYLKKDFADAHRYVYIKLRDGSLKKYYVYSVFKAEDASEAYDINIRDKEMFNEFAKYTFDNNTLPNSIEFDDNKVNRIVTLSTCMSGQNKLERCTVHMVEI